MEDNFRNNYGMMIPLGFTEMEDIKADPNGVPIYAGCPANGPCACTGKCKKIIGYDTNPDKIKAYYEDIERRNKLLKERRSSFGGNFKYKNIEGSDGKIRIWEWDNKQ